MFEINVSDLTNNVVIDDSVVTGNGIFDTLMKTCTVHLQAQFDSNRIRAEDYAEAYIALYTANLNVALQILMNKHIQEQQALNLAKDVEIKEYQLTEILPTEKQGLLKDIELKDAQLDKLSYEVTVVLPKEVEKLEEEIDLLQTQDSETLLNGTIERQLRTSQKNLVDAQTLTEGAKKLLIDRQKAGFDDAHLLDLLKSMTDSWSVVFSVAQDSLGGVYPDILTKSDTIDALGRGISSKLGIVLPTPTP